LNNVQLNDPEAEEPQTMARRSDHTRDELRELALAAAEKILTKEGPAGLTTRAVAARMGYTVGSLYLVFRNVDDLVHQLNARTLDELYQAMEAANARCGAADRCLLALADAYVAFAYGHEARWRLIFEHPWPQPAPDWLSERVARMFGLVEARLRTLAPRVPDAEVHKAAHALWGGVHGVCVLGLTDRLDTTGLANVQALAASLVTNYLAGFVRAGKSA
jgi:AcrR family transcriptional regulator